MIIHARRFRWFSYRCKLTAPFDTCFGVSFHVPTPRGDRLREVFSFCFFSFVTSVVVLRLNRPALACTAFVINFCFSLGAFEKKKKDSAKGSELPLRCLGADFFQSDPNNSLSNHLDVVHSFGQERFVIFGGPPGIPKLVLSPSVFEKYFFESSFPQKS